MFVNMRKRTAVVRAPPALTRRPTMLLLLLYQLLPTAGSAETTAPEVIFKSVEACPDVGYFFQREVDVKLEPGPCYLCFCKGSNHAVCSLRATERCDAELYTRLKRESRVRRGTGLSDIFFRDATRDLFNKNLEKQEDCQTGSSKSIGCPPADWCVGCMVCDCDANRHWDCHLMSFCPDNKSKSGLVKKIHHKNPFDARKVQKPPKSNKADMENRRKEKDTSGKKIVKKSITKSAKSFPAVPQISVETKKSFLRKKKSPDSPIVIKKYISTSSPIYSPELVKYKNDSNKMAQLLYKQYMTNSKKINNSLNKVKRKSPEKAKGDKILNKRSAIKRNIKQTKVKSRKPLNTKGHKDKSKIMHIKKKQAKKPYNRKKQINKKSNLKGKKYKGKKYDNSHKRSKRDVVLLTMEGTGNRTDAGGAETATNTTHNYQFSNVTEVSFTNNEVIHSNLNNYEYTVDSYVTPSIQNNQSTHNMTGYYMTERQIDIITVVDKKYITGNYNTNKENIIPTKSPEQVVYFTDSDLKTTAVFNDTQKELQFKNISKQGFSVTTEENSIRTVVYSNREENLRPDMKKKIYGQDIKKVITSKKKFNLKKFVKTLNSRNNKYNIINNKALAETKLTRAKINGTLNDIQVVLEKMLHGVVKNNTKGILKKKHLTAIQCLRKLFSRLLSRKNNKTSVEIVAFMDLICGTFGPCKISDKTLGLINFKIKELITETKTALNSINIIKGLLQLVHGRDYRNENSTLNEPDFNIHVKNLNAILKDNYVPERELTQTQITQINYIKTNTQVFIKSIGKFASILNDIINILKIENARNRYKHRHSIIKNKYKSKKEGITIAKMKNILLKYNFLQNTFLRKMYEGLTNIEEKIKNQNAKVYNFEQNQVATNNSYRLTVDKYVNNINDNLRKLKELASRNVFMERKKRDTMRDDDAVEYLLTLMEYLLKRNNPLDTPPVSDGIDLLIDAIRKAPDIKPLKKQVLQYMPINITGATNSVISREENVSKFNKMLNKNSNEHSRKSAKNKSLEYIPIKITGATDSGISREENVSKFDKMLNKNSNEYSMKSAKNKLQEDLADNIVVDSVERKIIDSPKISSDVNPRKLLNFADLSDLITEYPSKVYMATYNIDENTDKSLNDATNSATTVPIKKEHGKDQNEDDTIIMDEDNLKLIQKDAMDPDIIIQPATTTIMSVTKSEIENSLIRHYSPINLGYFSTPSEKPKTKLDLINEAYEQEIKELKVHTTVKAVINRIKGETGKRDPKASSTDISGVTKEIQDEEKDKAIEAEDVVYNKQMNLLNSLDYGTERSLAEDSDSKDNSPVDRFNYYN